MGRKERSRSGGYKSVGCSILRFQRLTGFEVCQILSVAVGKSGRLLCPSPTWVI